MKNGAVAPYDPANETATSGERPQRRELSQTLNQQVELQAPRRTREVLVRMDSANAGEVLPLDQRSLRVGRNPENDLCLDDPGMSRNHARITRLGTNYCVEDLNSSNGTFVNGCRVKAAQLNNGDTVQFGARVCFRFTLVSADEEQVLKQLYEASVRDPLTRAYNRQFFNNQLEGELAFSLRHHSELSLLLLDVDHFKRVNDTHGHPAGDAVLRAVVDVVSAQLRREDLMARYGGEEFILMLRGTPLAGAHIAAERLRNAVEQRTTEFGGQSIAVTISIGCASLTCCNHPSAQALVQRADGRLYQAKRDGRNRSVSTD